MLAAPETMPSDLPPLHSRISMPYTLTPGHAAGTFLAELANHRIVGSRFASGSVIAPAVDFSPADGEVPEALVEVPHSGVVTGFTHADGVVIGLVRLDGCDNDFPHRLLCDFADLAIGMRVTAEWDDEVEASILAIRGFVPAADAAVGLVRPLDDPAAALGSIAYVMPLEYAHAYGPYYGRLFDEIKANGRIIGVRSPGSDLALLPPREIDDISHKRTGTWKVCADTGTIRACSIINMEFIGQTRSPPYAYAEIVLDGASTKLIHMIDVDNVASAKLRIKPGTRVRAIWTSGERKGSLADIERFEVIDE